MKYNINVIKSVWGRLRKPSRATLDAIFSQKAVYAEANGKTDAQRRRNPIPIAFGWGVPFLSLPRRGGPERILPATIMRENPRPDSLRTGKTKKESAPQP
jgi:hypothetical protein